MDAQNDFCTGGVLAVPNNEIIFPVIEKLRESPIKEMWKTVIFSRDWHPADHCSFYVNHEGAEAYSTVVLESGDLQILWPVHC